MKTSDCTMSAYRDSYAADVKNLKSLNVTEITNHLQLQSRLEYAAVSLKAKIAELEKRDESWWQYQDILDDIIDAINFVKAHNGR